LSILTPATVLAVETGTVEVEAVEAIDRMNQITLIITRSMPHKTKGLATIHTQA